MRVENPYQLFSPIHLAWLYRRREKKLDVTAADLDSIERNHPRAVDDPLFVKCRALADAGQLYRRRGRKPLSIAGRLRLWAARFAIEEETARIWEERRSGRRRRAYGEDSPIHQAAESVAREFRSGAGRSLLNQLSREGVS
jgi:hypothetical protein